MGKLWVKGFGVFFILALLSCKENTNKKEIAKILPVDSLLQIRYQKILDYPVDSVTIPRSFDPKINKIFKVAPKDWTSGFYPGNLWQLYKLTENEAFKSKARDVTAYIEKEKFNDGTHDMGFKIYSSFGEGFEVTKSEHYENVIIESAGTLATRFNETVGSIRSWDFNKDIWEYPVIIDNMMNLELLFEATKISGDSAFHKIAVQHANTTLINHFRDDNSSFHVIVYDTVSGNVIDKVTHQGYNDSSSWARGQAWGIYGFTMCYRYTNNPVYLEQAEKSAEFYLKHKNLPNDGIPFWDFDDPSLPNALKDVSAATVVASALVELASFTNKSLYSDYSKLVLRTLKSNEYILSPGIEAPFILKHSTGNWPKKDEMDVSINYADFYFLELMLRLENSTHKKTP
ncbi:glycoside hydrolase family 88 protein [Maribacter litoralis]|uniref:Glycosyl Hydrolase Family 88 n=1 Tax=Maribacter litoralis TaxID=2059726 RepID=A0A653U6Y0_9FLAO|nr:glycoside hydrolase family 88 protein [Maribacter litoralis]VXB89486.1 Glycosyl Hydrolase Family 88 [Maribacter litoralis]